MSSESHQQPRPTSSSGHSTGNERARNASSEGGQVTQAHGPPEGKSIQPHQAVSSTIRAPYPTPQSVSTLFANASGVSVEGSCVQSYSGVNINLNLDIGRINNVESQPSSGACTALESVEEIAERIVDNNRSVNVEDNVNRPPPSIQRSCEIYCQHLATKGRGFPLWLPAANWNLPVEYRRSGARIGDVCIITADGSLDFLFNILLSPDDPVHAGGVPEMFSALHPPLNLYAIEKQEVFPEDSYLASETVEKKWGDGREHTSSLSFETTDLEGAILTIPKGSDSNKLLAVKRFREYLEANVESWYCYANGPCGREAKNGDLRLIIGWDKAKAWGMATFSRSSKAATSIRLDFKPTQQAGRNYKWEHSGIAEGKTGPSSREVAELRRESEPEDVTFTNQCLFIRTINHLLPDDVWAKLEATKFGTIKTQDSTKYSGSSSKVEKGKAQAIHSTPSLLDLVSPTAQLGSKNSNLTTSQLFHPSTSINKYLIRENPDARIVITEDMDWMSVLIEDDNLLPLGDHMVERIMKSFDISKNGGVVSLTPKTHSLSDSADGPQDGHLLKTRNGSATTTGTQHIPTSHSLPTQPLNNSPLSSTGASPLLVFASSNATQVLSMVGPTLEADFIKSNVLLPILQKWDRTSPNCDIDDHIWVVLYSVTTTPQPVNILYIASCTSGSMGKYPLFIYTPIPYSRLSSHRYESRNVAAMRLLVTHLLRHVPPSRVYSVFGQEILVDIFRQLWTQGTHIEEVEDPYYYARISHSTAATVTAHDVRYRENPNEESEIRLAKPEDCSAVANLAHGFASEHPPFILRGDQALQEAQILITNGQVWVYDVWPTGRPDMKKTTSIVAFSRNTNRMATITKVYTHPDFRGQRRAERLVRAVCKDLLLQKSLDCVALFVEIGNKAANVYRRVGFVGLEDSHPSEDAADRWVEIGFDPNRVKLGHWSP